MSTARWAVALISAIALPGCYGSNGQTKDGQSHWLERCSVASSCSDGRICACGVCTIACDQPAMCGAGGLCASVEESQCGASPSAPERVCLMGCSQDGDCKASGIECRTGACVNIGALTAGDASASDQDADSSALSDAAIVREVETVIDLDLGGGLGETNGAQRFVLVDGAIVWQTTTATEEDGYIFRMDLETEEITLLARPPASTFEAQLEVHGQMLFYTAGSDVRALHLSDATRSWSTTPAEGGPPIWTADATHLYYVAGSERDSVWRMPHDAGPEEMVYSTAGPSVVRIALDAQNVYIEELNDPVDVNTRVRRVAKDGSNPLTLVGALRLPIGYLTVPLAMFVHGDSLVSDERMHSGVEAHLLADGSRRQLTDESVAFASASSAAGAYVYFSESTGMGDASEQLFVSRVHVSSGRVERLHAASSFVTQITEANGYLYWIERGRVLRAVID